MINEKKTTTKKTKKQKKTKKTHKVNILLLPIFLFRVLCFCSVCLRHISCVPNVASFTGLFNTPISKINRIGSVMVLER